MCAPFAEGGLSFCYPVKLNEAFNLKIAWDFLIFSESWAVLLRSRILRKGKFIKHHIFSSIWSSLKYELQTILDNFAWCLDNGESISLWFDNWCSDPFYLEVDDMNGLVDRKVSNIIVNGD